MNSCTTTKSVAKIEKVPEFNFPDYPEINDNQLEFIYDGKICIKVTVPFWYFVAWQVYGNDNENAIAAFEAYRKSINGY